MSKVKILVCCHKKDNFKNDDIYMPIHVGKSLSNINLGIQGDNTGENISNENPHFCELQDYIGHGKTWNQWTI